MAREDLKKVKFEGGLHTKPSWLITLTAFLIMSYMGIKYAFSDDIGERGFGLFAFVHGFYCLAGLFLAPVILGESPFPIKKIETKTVIRAFVIFLSLFWLQFFISMLSISGTERKLYHIFSAVSEENFYRAFMINILRKWFMYLGVPMEKMFAVIGSSFVFTIGHLSYWTDPRAMITVFISGIILGLFYVQWNDLTANIAGHLGNNLLSTLVFSV